jgi:uncharacterized protein (TIGR00251 family)
MTPGRFNLRDGKRGAALAIRVIPRARKTEISEIMSDGTIKIKVTAPPVDGKANQALVDFLAKILDIPPSNIEIIAGETGRNKLVSILGMDADTAHQRIMSQRGGMGRG